MSNTNPSDLDREALKAAQESGVSNMSCSTDYIVEEAIKAYLDHLPRASGVPEAWREALEIIAGRRQSLDNLLSNKEVAEWALDKSPSTIASEPKDAGSGEGIEVDKREGIDVMRRCAGFSPRAAYAMLITLGYRITRTVPIESIK